MSRFLVWGTGEKAKQYYRFYEKIGLLRNDEIVGFVDNNCGINRMFKDKPVIAPSEIARYDYDYISIWTTRYEEEIMGQITERLGIPSEKISDIFLPYKELLRTRHSDDNEMELRQVIADMFDKNGIDVYYYKKEKESDVLNEVFYDSSADLQYTFFEGKRMYLKRTYSFFWEKDGKRYVGDLWGEQDRNSPHLYEWGEIKVGQGDILVDAGACEGNFSLHHIDKVRKAYLAECDKEWMEALHYTFLPYRDKVVFCDKFLSSSDSDKTICMDTLVLGKVDFIKMDIEGEEINALKGAQRVLSENDFLKCAICTYHRHGDEQSVKSILRESGFKTEVSKGYMLFLGDEYVLNTPEFRRGIVRGIKCPELD